MIEGLIASALCVIAVCQVFQLILAKRATDVLFDQKEEGMESHALTPEEERLVAEATRWPAAEPDFGLDISGSTFKEVLGW